jgi:hypothetical protein
MAKIVLGAATPHAPQLRLPLEGWRALAEKDRTDRRIDYDALLHSVRPGLDQELTDDVMQGRIDACAEYRGRLIERLEEARPDVLVVVGDDQHELFGEQNMPMFCVYYGSSVDVIRERRARHGSQAWSAPKLAEIQAQVAERLSVSPHHPAAPELGMHLIDSLRDDDFDVACSDRLDPATGVGHAFVYLYEFMLPHGDIPMVPLMINTFFPPNQPTPRRCYALGQALRAAIESWDSSQRVALVASGGLSHTVIDEEIDRMTLDAIMEKDAGGLRSLPHERLNLGTSEIRNWITVAGAMEPLQPRLIGDYIPAYRTPAGTGCGMAFAYWE